MTQPQSLNLGISADIPQPTFASVRVEFSDGSSREFHVHKPLRTEVDVTPLLSALPITGDLGALPPRFIPPTLPEVSIRMKAANDPRGAVVMAIDSRVADPRASAASALALLSEAADLRQMYGSDDRATDDLWRPWERKVEAFLHGDIPRG